MLEAKPNSFWVSTQEIAARTPESRNRYVDFLRAFSICVVVIGHWLGGLPILADGVPHNPEVLRVAPWTQWLTWIFQVMPVFFLVGGFSNAISWNSAKGKGHGYGYWATERMRRLVGPLVPLLGFWIIFALLLRQFGVEHEMVRDASRAALIPVWFLAVYLLVTAATPLTHRFYRKSGMASFWVLALAAAATDFISFLTETPALRWANYGFIWMAVHQLGFIWQGGEMSNARKSLLLSMGALGLLLILVNLFGYPTSMLTVPGEEVSNSRPPSLALLALGVFHAGLLVCMESPARRWLTRSVPWRITILINSRIMTLFLWHLTVMILLVAMAMILHPAGLDKVPGEKGWWLVRLSWLVGKFVILMVFVSLLGRFEHPARMNGSTDYPAWRVVAATLLLSFGLAMLVTGGISGAGITGLRLPVLFPTLAGVLLILWNNSIPHWRK